LRSEEAELAGRFGRRIAERGWLVSARCGRVVNFSKVMYAAICCRRTGFVQYDAASALLDRTVDMASTFASLKHRQLTSGEHG
jgi:hypothetical protein